MEVLFADLPEWETEQAVHADFDVEYALELLPLLDDAGRLALLDELGIEYSHLMDKEEEIEEEAEEEPFTIADLF